MTHRLYENERVPERGDEREGYLKSAVAALLARRNKRGDEVDEEADRDLFN
jgi:hypothetical protein